MTTLSEEQVNKVFMECLFRNEDVKYVLEVEGIDTDVKFHIERLENHKAEIMALLDELPEQFHVRGGGGWSFLSACDDKHGNQWTGIHQTMEQLFQLGIGIGKVKYLMPREIWHVLPHGMPYYIIT